jgi:hypothetical protein
MRFCRCWLPLARIDLYPVSFPSCCRGLLTVHRLQPSVLSWSKRWCVAFFPCGMVSVHVKACPHVQACLCHPTALGPALAARFILFRLMHRCGKPDPACAVDVSPSYVLAAVSVMCKRVSVTLVECVVVPRLLFVLGSVLKHCASSEPEVYHLSQKLDMKQQAHCRDTLACIASIIPRLSPTYIRTRVFGYSGSAFGCSHSPLLSALLGAVGQLHTSAPDVIPASLCGAIANAAASACVAALKIAPLEPIKPLLQPVIMAAMKRCVCVCVCVCPLFKSLTRCTCPLSPEQLVNLLFALCLAVYNRSPTSLLWVPFVPTSSRWWTRSILSTSVCPLIS